VEITGLIVCL